MNALDYKNAISYAIIFQQQIHRRQKELGDTWTWEAYLPGPIFTEEAEIIMAIAGCWCENLSEDSVRFYVNQNHPSWIRARQLYFEENCLWMRD